MPTPFGKPPTPCAAKYTADRVWVPPEVRWDNLQNQATRPAIATLIDDAILAVERAWSISAIPRTMACWRCAGSLSPGFPTLYLSKPPSSAPVPNED